MIVICTSKEQKGLDEYLKKYGPHFTFDLAEIIAGVLGEDAELTATEKSYLKGTTYTEGDLVYLRAMYRSDFESLTPDVINTLCKDTLHDKDGYEGMIFKRWLVDYENREYNIKWEDYL